MINNINFKHFDVLPSTNQKLYQLSEENCPSWTVVSCDAQSAGRGYVNNTWLSEPYQNATFSFLIRQEIFADRDLPYFNMWISNEIIHFLSKWQLKAMVKWPNDIILNHKKLGGILIESKLMGMKTKFSIVGIGLNLNQTDFGELEQATSMALEGFGSSIGASSFIKNLMVHFYENYFKIQQKKFTEILEEYNFNLFRKNQISVFDWNDKRVNGIIKKVNPDGNILIDIEEMGEKLFKFKEIKLLY